MALEVVDNLVPGPGQVVVTVKAAGVKPVEPASMHAPTIP